MVRSSRELVILMADDDEEDQLLVKDALAELPARVKLVFVDNGAQLMDYLYCRGQYKLKDHPRPNLILLDLNMPLKDGRQALQEIKADPKLKAIPVVILTTSSEGCDVTSCYQLGANSYMVKPLTFDDLIQTLKVFHMYWADTLTLSTPQPPDNCLEKPAA